MALAQYTVKNRTVTRTVTETRREPTIILELDLNEAEAIQYFAMQGASRIHSDGMNNYRERVNAGTLAEGSLAASIVRVHDAITKPLSDARVAELRK